VSITVTDLFCGAGGSSIGAEVAGATLRLGLNHWKRAIETHATNFEHADHDCEDVNSLTTAQIRRYPDSDILLASPECTNHSLAKGARRRKPQASSLFDDGPAGDDEQERSRATMWDVCRFAEQKVLKGRPYKAILVENVVDAFNWGPEDNGALFDAWLTAMDGLGYHHEIVWLNSMFAGHVPQSRDRMYVVFWKKGIRAPDLRFSPPSWCPDCERLVEGSQAFKRQRRGRNWGRYGPQYLFRCPACSQVVFPGAHPAATAIDWTIPAGLIGERDRPLAKATRERIRRGLERLAAEPFAIRLLQSGNPKPLTLPLVTLTARHDLAMVMPVAGNTYERTPGNRARDAATQPHDTVHGTLDRAMVVPAGGSWDEKATLAEREVLTTQTGTESKALVLANRAHNVPRVADEEAMHPVLTGSQQAVVVRNNGEGARGNPGRMSTPSHEPFRTFTAHGGRQAVVMRNNKGGAEMSTPADTEPIRTLTAGCHQSLIVPYDRTGRAADSDREPAPTLTTRDRLAMVVPFTRNGRPRDADADVAPTMATEGPPGLVEAKPLTEDDIDACRFRMFELGEISRAMAMHEHPAGGEYQVLGNKRERMAQYGNAVTPPAMERLVERVTEVLG
jgi:DNA (cytosine-5)-methyltransferase 1